MAPISTPGPAQAAPPCPQRPSQPRLAPFPAGCSIVSALPGMCREGGRGGFITSQVPGCSYTWHCLHPSPTPNSPTCSPSLPGSRDWGSREELPAVTTARDPKESNGEQAQALVSWIYFSFLSVSRVGFHRTLCSRGKHGFAAHGSGAGTGTSAPIPALARRLSPLPSMTLICLNLFFFVFGFFYFFPFFFFAF